MDSGALTGIGLAGLFVLIFSIVGVVGAFGGKSARARTQGMVLLFVLGLLCAGAGVWLLTSVASVDQVELMRLRAAMLLEGQDPRLIDGMFSAMQTLSKALLGVGAVDLCLGIGAAVRASSRA